MKKLLLALFLLLFITPAYATCNITALPFILQNGTTADATQVMADLNQIFNGVQANCAAAGANTDITSLQGVNTGQAATAGQIGELKLQQTLGGNSTITFSNGSANIIWGANTPTVGSRVYFSTTGSLPTNFAANTNYYVISQSGTTITVSSTYNGSAIVAGSAGSGTQTGIAAALEVGTGTQYDIGFIILSPGDWTCSANTAWSIGGGSVTAMYTSISNTSNTQIGLGNEGYAAAVVQAAATVATGEIDFNSNTNQPVFLVSQVNGSALNVASFGSLRCRRVR